MRKVRALPALLVSLEDPGPALPDPGPALRSPGPAALVRHPPGPAWTGARGVPACARGGEEGQPPREGPLGGGHVPASPALRGLRAKGRFFGLSENLPGTTKTGREPSFCETQAVSAASVSSVLQCTRGGVLYPPPPPRPELRKVQKSVSRVSHTLVRTGCVTSNRAVSAMIKTIKNAASCEQKVTACFYLYFYCCFGILAFLLI